MKIVITASCDDLCYSTWNKSSFGKKILVLKYWIILWVIMRFLIGSQMWFVLLLLQRAQKTWFRAQSFTFWKFGIVDSKKLTFDFQYNNSDNLWVSFDRTIARPPRTLTVLHWCRSYYQKIKNCLKKRFTVRRPSTRDWYRDFGRIKIDFKVSKVTESRRKGSRVNVNPTIDPKWTNSKNFEDLKTFKVQIL